MGAGAYSTLYKLQRQAGSAKDPAGQLVPVWKTLGGVRGRAVNGSQRQALDAGGVVVRTEEELEMPWDPRVDARCRLIQHPSGRILNITGVYDPDNERRQRLRVNVVEVEA